MGRKRESIQNSCPCGATSTCSLCFWVHRKQKGEKECKSVNLQNNQKPKVLLPVHLMLFILDILECYVRGAKNPKAQEAEIKSTAKKYKEGKLTKADMDRIAKKRSKNVTKKYKKASETRKKRLA